MLFNTHITAFNPLCYIGQDSYQSGVLAGRLIHFGNPSPCSVLIAHVDEELSNAAHLARKEEGFRSYFDKLSDYTINRIGEKRYEGFQPQDGLCFEKAP